MYVWENPVHVKFPVSDFLGDLVAEAGEDQCVTESTPGEGVDVTLDASGSRNLAGPIASYTWHVQVGAGCQTWTGKRVTIRLPEGSHTVELTVKDDAGNVSSDTVMLRVSR
jgi:PKD domain